MYERREIIIGHSHSGRLIIVCFTEKTEGLIRIVSARPATKRERESCAENVKMLRRSQELRKRICGRSMTSITGRQSPIGLRAVRLKGAVSVTLDPDVSKVFQTPDSVNKALRALIEAMPPPKSRRKKASA